MIKAAEEIMGGYLQSDIRSYEIAKKDTDAGGGETCVIIGFVGKPTGVFRLKCSISLASKIASNMLGMEVQGNSEEMRDAIAELFNMVVGFAKTIYSSDEVFKISVPTTIVGDDYSVHTSSDRPFTAINFNSNGDAFSIEVLIK
jgi:chemotaxis protein CheX